MPPKIRARIAGAIQGSERDMKEKMQVENGMNLAKLRDC